MFVSSTLSSTGSSATLNGTLSMEEIGFSLQNKWLEDDSRFRLKISSVQTHVSQNQLLKLEKQAIDQIVVSILANVRSIDAQFSLASFRSIFIFKEMWLDKIPFLLKVSCLQQT